MDDYEVLLDQRLGGGTFSTIYLGQDMRTNDSVAIEYIEPPVQHRTHIMRYMQNEINISNQ